MQTKSSALVISLAVLFLWSGTAFTLAAQPEERKNAMALYSKTTSLICSEYYDDRARSREFKAVVQANAKGIQTRAEAINAAQNVIAKLGDPFTSLLDQRRIETRSAKQSGVKVLSPVKVKIKKGNEEITKTMQIRAERVAVQAAWIDRDTAYLSIADFDNKLMPVQLERAVATENLTTAKNLVLDLRGNVGGFLSNAAQTLGFLIGSATNVAKLQTAHGTQPLNLIWPKTNPQFKGSLIVLVNNHSASASELVAAAVQKHKRGLLVGEKTSGSNIWKGDRTIEPGLILYLAFAKWNVHPGKFSGLMPEKVITLTAEDQQNGRGPWFMYNSIFDPQSDVQRDKQLRAAIDSFSHI